jgi:DNA polymerase III epsilon subunit-like protein|tara:strand:+ start:1416 stop:2258 length:843 start_codon:yes stop_codon:yes gene_type:complete
MAEGIDSDSWPKGKKLVFVDFETTGFQLESSDRVVEVAFKCIHNGEILQSEQQLIYPQRSIPLFLTEDVHGISNEMVRNASLFPEACSLLVESLEDAIFIAHNANFDLKCLISECLRFNILLPEFICVDSLVLSRRFLKNTLDHKLTTLAESLGIDASNAHRAMADVSMMIGIFDFIFRNNDIESTSKLVEIAGISSPNVTLQPENKEFYIHEQKVTLGKDYRLLYLDAKGNCTERIITIRRIYGNSMTKWIEAHCHLRMEMRTFNSDRIESIVPHRVLH